MQSLTTKTILPKVRELNLELKANPNLLMKKELQGL